MIRFFVGGYVAEVKGSIQEINQGLRSISQQLADEMLPKKISPMANMLCSLGIYEFLKNVLHGGHRIVEIERLPTGNLLIFTSDLAEAGLDELDPSNCGRKGLELIEAIFGKENHRKVHHQRLWQTELFVKPERVLKAAG